jgi:NTE family protein
MDRLNEISFNASVAGELRTVAVVQSLLDRGQLKTAGGYQRLRFHAISADGKLSNLNLPSKFNTDWGFLENLKKRGREAADDWLKADLEKLGEQSSFSLAQAFL